MKYFFNEFRLKLVLISVLMIVTVNGKHDFQSTRNTKVNRVNIPDIIPRKTWINSNIGFQLSETSFGYKLIEIIIPGLDSVFPLCYPRTYHESVDAALVSHIICRQMGYMSYESMQQERISFNRYSERILPSSLGCTGNENSISQCKWNLHINRHCTELLTIKCSDCNKEIRDISGVLRNPGFPLFFPYSVLCEWKIAVPSENFLEMVVNYFLLPNEDYSDCGIGAPHLEIIYGEQNGLNMQRFCKIGNGRNITIPYSKVKIRLFTGGNNRSLYGDNYGINIKFRAVPIPENSIPLVLAILMVVILCLSLIVLCVAFFGCFKRFSRKEQSQTGNENNPPPPNAPRYSDYLQAYEFRRVALKNKARNLEILNKERSNSWSLSKSGKTEDTVPFDSSVPPLAEANSMILTPRNIFPKIGRRGKRAARTHLLEKFRNDSESKDSRKLSDSSVFLPPRYPPFEIYHSVSSAGSQEDKPERHETYIISNLSCSPGSKKRFSNIPSIVIQCVDGCTENAQTDSK